MTTHTAHTDRCEDYLALGEQVLAEYIDQRIVMVPPPSLQHQFACGRLVRLLECVVPDDRRVIAGAGWKPDADEFVPDVMVFEKNDETMRFTGTPDLVVEVLSSNAATISCSSSTVTQRSACRTTGSSTHAIVCCWLMLSTATCSTSCRLSLKPSPPRSASASVRRSSTSRVCYTFRRLLTCAT